MSIRKLLSPFLIISYVCGLKVIEFPRGILRQWSLLYMLLLWSLYNLIFIYVVIPYTIHYSILYHIWIGINMFIAFMSIIIGMYYHKAFKNCIRSVTAVDDTLEKLGITTDYKLHMRTIWFILGWFILATLIICLEILHLNNEDNIASTICTCFIRVYYININIISDLTIMSMLWYVGVKFDQINEHLEILTSKTKQTWEQPVIVQQFKYTASRNGYIVWIIIHLHLELRKISRTINLIFGAQMTIEMACYFIFLAWDIQKFFDVILIKDYHNKIYYLIIVLLWLFSHLFRNLFFMNYEYEKVCTKANATGSFISKLSYSNCDIEIRENILQFLLMIQSPFTFCGLGFFQFGFRFLQRFSESVATVLVILLQAFTNKYVHC